MIRIAKSELSVSAKAEGSFEERIYFMAGEIAIGVQEFSDLIGKRRGNM
ncbi:MAG: hypothetical protein IJ794_17860 [Lachnospiraceae bacterium]|nr:hypothetical protein [Lachnospiraceae bacterium]